MVDTDTPRADPQNYTVSVYQGRDGLWYARATSRDGEYRTDRGWAWPGAAAASALAGPTPQVGAPSPTADLPRPPVVRTLPNNTVLTERYISVGNALAVLYDQTVNAVRDSGKAHDVPYHSYALGLRTAYLTLRAAFTPKSPRSGYRTPRTSE